AHDPTQEMRQGNDVGTQYRSAIYTTSDEQRALVEATAMSFGDALRRAGYGAIATDIAPLGEYYFAEDYHQQYLAKVPHGYCGLAGTGQVCSVGVAKTS
ncbi:MAG: peptide-methionine (S)-S-oxide reductase, partial [Mycobacteriales bacterium]